LWRSRWFTGCSPRLAATSSLNPSIWLYGSIGVSRHTGHSKSIWLGCWWQIAKFGRLLAMSWQRFGNAGCFGVVLALSRIVSLSSIAGAIAVSMMWVNRCLSAVCCSRWSIRHVATPQQHPLLLSHNGQNYPPEPEQSLKTGYRAVKLGNRGEGQEFQFDSHTLLQLIEQTLLRRYAGKPGYRIGQNNHLIWSPPRRCPFPDVTHTARDGTSASGKSMASRDKTNPPNCPSL